MFGLVKSWDNRGKPARIGPNGRTWTRRIQWLEDETQIKLKLECDAEYREVLVVDRVSATTIWTRFKDGQSINDAVSILGDIVPQHLQSRKGS